MESAVVVTVSLVVSGVVEVVSGVSSVVGVVTCCGFRVATSTVST